MKQFLDIDILIVKQELKNNIIETLNKKELFNIKVMSLNELRQKYYFTYDEKALSYLINKYGYNIDVARVYLSKLYDVQDNDYNSDKIKKIIELKKELKEEGLLIYNSIFRNYLKDKKIMIYNYYDLDKKDELLIEELKQTNRVVIYNDEIKEYNHLKIYMANTLEEEVSFIASDIVEKINSNIDINSLKIVGVTGEYSSVIKRIFKWYNIPISINDSTLYATKIGQDVINNLNNNSKDLIELLKSNYNKNNEKISSIINKIIKILNKYIWADSLFDVKELIIDDIKQTKITSEEYTDEVKILNSLEEAKENDYVYLIGFNQGTIPICYKDEDYFNDFEKEKLKIDTTSDLNKREYNKWLFDIKRTKNLIITSKKNSSLGEHYISSLNDELNLEIENIEIKYNYSNLFNKIKLTEKLDKLVKYNEKDEMLESLYSNYKKIDYNNYDSRYKGIDKNKIQEYINKKLVLSYSAMNTFYQCSFRYYLSNILKLNIYEETFYTILGNLFHHVLSKYYKENFNLKEEYQKYLSTCTYNFNEREKFFLNYLESELEFIIKTIKKQNETNSLSNILAEEKIEINKSKNGIEIIFKGFVDKIMINEDASIISIIDYKTGNPKLNLNNVIYGLDLQLPVYIYLAKNKFPNAAVAGFYLQKILNSEITKDFKHTYEELKEDKLKLQGYSNIDLEILSKFDSGYNDSKVIKGMKTSSKGISSKKILSNEEIEKLSNITSDKIDEAIEEILNAKFDINPKKIGMENVGCEFCGFKDICFMKEEMIKNLKEYKNMEFLGGEENDTN